MKVNLPKLNGLEIETNASIGKRFPYLAKSLVQIQDPYDTPHRYSFPFT